MDLSGLRQRFTGEILTPDAPGYNGAKQIWNGMIDRHPAAIARCSGPADVVAAVRFAAENDIYPAIRAGGHNVAGLAMVDDGLVIDVTPMRGIHVDAANRTAVAQTGHTWGSFDRETELHGLATTGGVISTTGIAGLTLGGGVGWLMGRCGLSCDNTLAYELVTADGKLQIASADENPDLFWALKGGGGNFGVVTSITYRLHPVSTVLAGMILHPLARGTEVLRFYRDFVEAGIPDELMVYAGVTTTPDGMAVLALMAAYCGEDLGEGERRLAPLRSFGPPIADLVQRMPYTAMQQQFDAAAPYGMRSYWKSTYLRGLPDPAIETYLEHARRCPSPRTFMLIEHAHGAASRVSPTATAFAARGEPYDLVLMSLWADHADDRTNIEFTRGFYSSMQPWSAGHVYVNTLSEDESGRVREAYGVNFQRLCEVKARYDPGNRFRRNQNILPAARPASA